MDKSLLMVLFIFFNKEIELTFIMPGLVQELAFMILKELYRRAY